MSGSRTACQKKKCNAFLMGSIRVDFTLAMTLVNFAKNSDLPESAFLVGSIGRLDELKNYDVLIAALGQLKDSLPEVHLAVLGDGPRKERLKALAEELGVAERVHLLGFRNRPESFLAALDVFALPSKYEGMSNVVLEAMSSGLPIVCADLPSHREVFSPGIEGEIVSPSTAELWAQKLGELYRESERRRALGLAARAKIIERFSIENMVRDYDRLYAAYHDSEIGSMVTARQVNFRRDKRKCHFESLLS